MNTDNKNNSISSDDSDPYHQFDNSKGSKKKDIIVATISGNTSHNSESIADNQDMNKISTYAQKTLKFQTNESKLNHGTKIDEQKTNELRYVFS